MKGGEVDFSFGNWGRILEHRLLDGTGDVTLATSNFCTTRCTGCQPISAWALGLIDRLVRSLRTSQWTATSFLVSPVWEFCTGVLALTFATSLCGAHCPTTQDLGWGAGPASGLQNRGRAKETGRACRAWAWTHLIPGDFRCCAAAHHKRRIVWCSVVTLGVYV